MFIECFFRLDFNPEEMVIQRKMRREMVEFILNLFFV
jgi:hypothetical protein